jgi:hypothetical protein
MPPIGFQNPLLQRRRRSTVKSTKVSSPIFSVEDVEEAGMIQDLYPKSKSPKSKSPKSPSYDSYDSYDSKEKDFFGSKDDLEKPIQSPRRRESNTAFHRYYFKNKTQLQSDIETQKREIQTNIGCRQVDKFRALLNKRGLGGFDLPTEPEYASIHSSSKITEKQAEYLEHLKKYISHCNDPRISLRLKELRNLAIDQATQKRRSGGRATRRRFR